MSNRVKTIVILTFALFFVFSFTSAQTLSNGVVAKTLKNIGFIQDNIWYSKDPFFEGDKVRIYTAVLNASQYDFKGVIEFYAGGKFAGKSNFSLVSGGFQVLWADWVAEEGNKKIYANITEAKISLPGGAEETVILENAKTGEMEIFVDKDSDKDGIGDKKDPKDDRIKEEKKEAKPKTSVVSDLPESNSFGGGGVSSLVPSSKEAVSLVQEGVSKINNFLDAEKNKAETKKAELQKKLSKGESLFEFDFRNLLGKKEAPTEVGAPTSAEPSVGKNKNLLKLYLLALTAFIFTLEYKILIYLLGIYISYRILKFFIKKIFFRRVDKS